MFPSLKKQLVDFEEYLVTNKKSLKEYDAINLLMRIRESTLNNEEDN